MPTYKSIVITTLVSIVVAGVVTQYAQPLSQFSSKGSSFGSVQRNQADGTTSQTDRAASDKLPFVELTIPYLRARSYQSQLTTIETLSDAPNYQRSIAQYTADGLKINGLLTQPKTEMPVGGWSAIIFVHGYIPPTQYRTLEKYEAYVDYLAKNGFVVFKIDLRGHGESEGEASGAYYSGDYVSDVLHAKAALQTADFVNPTKIGLWGHSMAGNVVLRGVAASSEFPAAVIWGGAVFSYQDWLKYGLQDHSYRPPRLVENRQSKRQLLGDAHGDFDPNSEFWKLVPATNFLGDRSTAIQLHHAVDDAVVSINYSRDLATTLAVQQKTYEFHEYQSGGHNISGQVFTVAMQRTVEWYRKWLED
jgi:uncharacterized protein